MSAAYIDWPEAGELNRRVTIRRWTDTANAAFGIDQAFDAGIDRWAKMQPVSGAAFWGSKQTGEEITHRFWLRWGTGTKPEEITGQHVIDYQNRRYRVMRSSDLGNAQRFTMIECKDLGAIA